MGDGSRTDACLVRESGPLEALDQRADHAARDTQTRERTFNDLPERPADHVGIDDQDDQSSPDVEDTHEWHDLLGYLGDGLDAADDHRKDHSCEDDTRDPARIVSYNARKLRVCLVGLEHVPTAQGPQNAENREQNRQDLAAGQAKLLEAL